MMWSRDLISREIIEMKSNRWIGGAALSGLLIALLAIGNTSSPGQAPAAKPAVAWEYKSTMVGNDEDLHSTLNGWGAQGWEMVTAYTRGVGGQGGVVYLFKRAKPR
jgi:hypothetical protein